jgi:DNA-directed RNA polymerase specialized sigma24 family protein
MNRISSPSADAGSSLFGRAHQRETDAWLQLVRWFGPGVLRWCRDAGLPPADCAAVASKVVEDVWRGLPAFRRDNPDQSFRGWLAALTRNHLTPRVWNVPADTDAWTRRALYLLVQELAAEHANDPTFKAFHRTAVDGLSIADAARELGLKPWTVRQHRLTWTGRLRERLRHQFGELLG